MKNHIGLPAYGIIIIIIGWVVVIVVVIAKKAMMSVEGVMRHSFGIDI